MSSNSIHNPAPALSREAALSDPFSAFSNTHLRDLKQVPKDYLRQQHKKWDRCVNRPGGTSARLPSPILCIRRRLLCRPTSHGFLHSNTARTRTSLEDHAANIAAAAFDSFPWREIIPSGSP